MNRTLYYIYNYYKEIINYLLYLFIFNIIVVFYFIVMQTEIIELVLELFLRGYFIHELINWTIDSFLQYDYFFLITYKIINFIPVISLLDKFYQENNFIFKYDSFINIKKNKNFSEEENLLLYDNLTNIVISFSRLGTPYYNLTIPYLLAQPILDFLNLSFIFFFSILLFFNLVIIIYNIFIFLMIALHAIERIFLFLLLLLFFFYLNLICSIFFFFLDSLLICNFSLFFWLNFFLIISLFFILNNIFIFLFFISTMNKIKPKLFIKSIKINSIKNNLLFGRDAKSFKINLQKSFILFMIKFIKNKIKKNAMREYKHFLTKIFESSFEIQRINKFKKFININLIFVISIIIIIWFPFFISWQNLDNLFFFLPLIFSLIFFFFIFLFIFLTILIDNIFFLLVPYFFLIFSDQQIVSTTNLKKI